MSSEDSKHIIRQNEVIISLLGRIAFSEDQVREIITKNKQAKYRAGYLAGFNACDGNKTTVEIAKVVGVARGTLSPILSEWETIGIIYEVSRPSERQTGKYYKKIFPVDM